MRRSATVAVLAAALVAVTVPAWAAWQANGTGSGTGTARSLGTAGAPTASSSTQTSITLAWSAATGMPSGPTIAYQVERQPAAGGSWVAACTGTHATPNTATTCTDGSLTAGTGYKYRIVSAYQAWRATGTESAVLSTQAAPVATTMTATLSASRETTNSGGGANYKWAATVTITVKDNLGNVVSGAEVDGTWTYTLGNGNGNGNVDGSVTSDCTTDASGVCTVSSPNMQSNVISATFTRDGITKSGLTYSAPTPKQAVTAAKPS